MAPHDLNVHPNVPAKDIPYFPLAQIPPAGKALIPQPDGKQIPTLIPTLFQPFKIRGVEFHSRIMVYIFIDNGR